MLKLENLQQKVGKFEKREATVTSTGSACRWLAVSGLIGTVGKVQGAPKIFVQTLLFFSNFLESPLDKIYIRCYYKKRKKRFL